MTLDTAPATPFAADVLEALEPIHTDDLVTFINAAAQMTIPVEATVRATSSVPVAYGPALNLTACPDWLLPWLSQFVGVMVRPAAPADERTQIAGEAGFYRGGVDTLAAAIAATLTGDRYVRVIERAPNIIAVVRSTEAPNFAQTQAAGLAAKAAGLLLTVVEVSGRTYAEVEASHTGTYATVEAGFTTYADAEANA